MTDAAPVRSRTWSERTANGAFAFRRAFREFLTLPLLMMLAFFVLGVLLYMLDQSSQASNGFYAFFKSHIFNSSQAARDLLGIMAMGVLTITSITITVPLGLPS